MFLTSLKLENVRCFKKLHLDFTEPDGPIRQRTAILGENGTGKSTILRALALITAGSDALTEVIGDPQYWIRNNTHSCRIEAVLRTLDGVERPLSLEIGREHTLSDIVSASQETLAPLNDALRHTARNYFVAGYGTSRRLASSRSASQRSSPYRDIRAQSIATLFDVDAVLNPLESWAMDLDYRRSGDGINTVRSVLSDFLPGLTFREIDKDRGFLLFDTADGVVPLQYLSDGYQNVAAWIGDLLYRITNVFDDYHEPLNARGLLIIDELGLHLHPKWQRVLYSFVQRKLPNMQLIVTTHSPVTAQQARGDEIHYLKRRGKAITLRQFGTDPSRLLVNQLLMSEAFGLETDESLRVEQTKARYRLLRDANRRTSAEEFEFESLKQDLQTVAQTGATNMQLHEEQVALLKQVQSELSTDS